MGTLDNIKHWLFDSAQIMDDSEPGGVVGALDSQGHANYYYGEIAGYFLTFLAFLESVEPDARSNERARRVLTWLLSQWTAGPALTRVLIAQKEREWRNCCVFSFDIAMILRGLALACRANLLDVHQCAPLTHALEQELRLFIGENGTLAACRRRNGFPEDVPVRWSTSVGPFQLKTAAGILSASSLGLAKELQTAADRTFTVWRSALLESRQRGDLHPFFYHLEGLLMVAMLRDDRDANEIAGELFGNLIADDPVMSRLLSRDVYGGEPPRSDVISQAIRVGSVLMLEGVLPAAQLEGPLQVLEDRLLDFIDPDGAVRFNEQAAADAFNRNTFCTMFAFQALALRRRGLVLPPVKGTEHMLI